jgi:hypothetical protein
VNENQRNSLKLAAILAALMLLYCPYEEVVRLDMPALPQGFKFILQLSYNQRINSNQLFVQYAALGFITVCVVGATSDKRKA